MEGFKIFTFDEVLEELNAEESELLQCNCDSDLVAMNSIVWKEQKQWIHSNENVRLIKCYKCGKIGRSELNCWSEGKKSRKKNPHHVNALFTEACVNEKD
ncbi:hypothetical protein TNCT_536721 [Trichonephila clavata]|uniref:Uncharacterized protein n=1 Tax=Trichonephila clavata TaxID=2740835 RepID=A0A8X6L2B5_TRICU|nr:hypothetical protein TNCT_536721 [Trichonephila clavata]